MAELRRRCLAQGVFENAQNLKALKVFFAWQSSLASHMEQREGRQHPQRWPDATLRLELKAGDDDMDVEGASEICRKNFEEASDATDFASTTSSAINSTLCTAW